MMRLMSPRRTAWYQTLEKSPKQTAHSVSEALGGLGKRLALEGLHVEGIGASGEHVTGRLRVEVAATSNTPATTLNVPVEVHVVPELAPGGVHGADAGHARLSIDGRTPSEYRLRIEIDARLASESDVQHNLTHELREARFILEDLTQGRYTDVARAQEARVFRPGTEEDPSPHDRAAAPELGDLFTEAQRALRAYAEARREAGRRKGPVMEPSVRNAGEIAMRRLDAALDAMGFADPATRAAKREALLDMLGEGEKSPLAQYIEAYGERTEGRVRRRAALDRLPPPDREALALGLGADLDAYLAAGVPDGAFDPLSQAMRRGDPGNHVRNVLRELVRQHRAGRMKDQQLVDVAQRLELMLRRYPQGMQQPARAGDVYHALQTDPLTVLVELDRVEMRIVQTGITEAPVAAPAAGAVHFHPEPELLGTGLHGIGWPEVDARARAARAEPDQGRFGTPADVWYAVQCARQLAPPGHGQAAGVFRLPPGHQNVVFRNGVRGTVAPDVLFVQVRPGGEIHAYPADSTSPAFQGAHLGAIRPIVTW